MILHRQTFFVIPPSWNSSVNSRVSNDSCGCTEVLRPSQTANHHLALSGTVFSWNIPSNWLNLPPHPLAFSKVKTFTVTSFPVCPNARLAFKLLHCSAYCSVTWYPWRDASPWSVCVNWSPLLLLPPVFCLWLKPDGSMKSRFGLTCSGPRSFTQMCPVLLYVFILFFSFKWDWFLQGLSYQTRQYGRGGVWVVCLCECLEQLFCTV